MAVRDDFIEALNACIDRLNQGETVEEILRDHPTFANQLRPMLEAGLLFPRARFPFGDAETAQEPIIREAVRREFRRGFRWTRWLVLLLVIGGGIVGVIIIGGGGESPVLALTASATLTSTPPFTATTTETSSPTSTFTATLTSTATLTASATETPSPTGMFTATPTSTATFTVTPTETLTSTSTFTAIPSSTNTASVPPTVAAAPGRIIVEGPVNTIQDNIITIYDLRIRLQPGDPVLTVLRPGDIVRIEGIQEVEVMQAITVIFVNITVVIVDGQVWRGDSCASPPPAWAQAAASDWYRRCAVPAPSSGSSSGNSSGGSNADDDDD
mgnify:CR=1 FL=1